MAMAGAVMAAGIVAAVPGGALGAGTGGLVYPTAVVVPLPDVTVSGDGVTEGEVACPTDFPTATGGGVQIEGIDPEMDLEVHGSGPSDTGWSVAGNNNTGLEATMTVHAICARGPITVRTKAVSIKPNGAGATIVGCRAGTSATGGGAAIIGGTHSDEVTSSEPTDGPDADRDPDDGWYGSAGNGSGQATKLRVWVVCAGRGTYHVVHSVRRVIPRDSAATARATCPPGTRVTGGGEDIDRGGSKFEDHDSFPFDGPDTDTDPDDGWQATGYNESSAGPRHLTVWAICKDV
ncbi:MAG: hypothetical protein U0869_14050 [Chloroflexota bacterium]